MKKTVTALMACAIVSPAVAGKKPPRIINGIGQPPVLLIPVAEKFIAPGKDVTLGKNQQFARYAIRRVRSATLDKPYRVSISGVSVEVPASDELKPAFPDLSMADRIPAKSAIYCAFKQPDVPEWLRPLSQLYGKDTRLCLADFDADMRFDRIFLSGTKKEADTSILTLEPIPFRLLEPPKEAREFVWFAFERYIPLFGEAGFKIRYERDGKVEDAGLFNFQSGQGLLSYNFYSANGGYPEGYLMYSPPKSLPFTITIGQLSFQVTAMDKVNGTISIKLEGPAQPMIAEVATLQDLPISFAPAAPRKQLKAEKAAK